MIVKNYGKVGLMALGEAVPSITTFNQNQTWKTLGSALFLIELTNLCTWNPYRNILIIQLLPPGNCRYRIYSSYWAAEQRYRFLLVFKDTLMVVYVYMHSWIKASLLHLNLSIHLAVKSHHYLIALAFLSACWK